MLGQCTAKHNRVFHFCDFLITENCEVVKSGKNVQNVTLHVRKLQNGTNIFRNKK